MNEQCVESAQRSAREVDCGDNDDEVDDGADDVDNFNDVGEKKSTYNPLCREMKMVDGQWTMDNGQWPMANC